MKKIKWVKRSCCVIAAVVLSGSLITGGPSTALSKPAEECGAPWVEVASWLADGVDSSSLTWEDLAAYSPEGRRILAANLTEGTRAKLRREHLSRLAEHDRFGPEQKALIQRVRDRYEEGAPETTSDTVLSLEEEVSRLFSREEVWLVFRTLGPWDSVSSTSEEGSAPNCSCRNTYSDCDFQNGEACVQSGCRAWFGCGPLGLWICTGDCFVVR